jgi:chromate transporter
MDDGSHLVSCRMLFCNFLKTGSTAVGGLIALNSVVRSYIVALRQFLSLREILDGVSLAIILPSPIVTNVVAHVGCKLRVDLGTLVCIAAVVLPAFLLAIFLNYGYFT